MKSWHFLVLIIALAPCPALADVNVTIYARPGDLVPSFGIESRRESGHAWIEIVGVLEDGTQVREAWGFYGSLPGEGNPVTESVGSLRAVVSQIPGGIGQEIPERSDAFNARVSTTVPDSTYRRIHATLDQWGARARNYNALVQSCVTLVDQIAGDAGLVRPSSFGRSPIGYVTELGKLNPENWNITPAVTGPDAGRTLSPDEYRQRVEGDRGLALTSQATALSATSTVFKATVSVMLDRARQKARQLEELRGRILEAVQTRIRELRNQQSFTNRQSAAAIDAAVRNAAPPVVIQNSEPRFRGTIDPIIPPAEFALMGRNALRTGPEDQAETRLFPMRLSLAGTAAPSTTPTIWMGYVPAGRRLELGLDLEIDEPLTIEVTPVDGEDATVDVSQGESSVGVAGGPNNQFAVGPGSARLVVSVTPTATVPFFRLIGSSRGTVMFDLVVSYLVFMRERVTLRTEAYGLWSGLGREFSEIYPVSIGPSPFGYRYLRHRGWTVSNNRDHFRDCGNWVECIDLQANDENVTVGFQIQGHHETGLAAQNRDFSANGFLEVDYQLRTSPPAWLTGPLELQ